MDIGATMEATSVISAYTSDYTSNTIDSIEGTDAADTSDPPSLDYAAVPQPVAVLAAVLGAVALIFAGLLARFLDRAVLRPAWTSRDLPCENALYLLFSVVVADVLQAGCELISGLQLLFGRWLLSRPLCRLWALLDAVSSTSRLLFLLAINLRLLRDDHWPRPLKVTLIALIWLLSIAGSYLAVRPFGLRNNNTCGPEHEQYVQAASLWQYVANDSPGLALLPVAIATYLWFHGRLLGGADGADDGQDGQGSADRLDASDSNDAGAEEAGAATSEHDEAQAGASVGAADARPSGSESENKNPESPPGAATASAAPSSPMPYAQRLRKLERCDTYTPSTFTLKKFWGMPSVSVDDELSSSSGFTGLAEDGEEDEDEEAAAHRRGRRLTLHQVTEVRVRLHRFVLLLSLAHFTFSLGAFVVHVLTDMGLTTRDPWRTCALVLDLLDHVQPLATALLFTCMFPRFYKMLCK